MINAKVELRCGEVVFFEGDAPTTAFLIESGSVEISTTQADEVVVLGRLGPGDLLGEMAVIDASPRTATATAIADSVLVAIDQATIHERVENADPVVRALIRGQLKRYRTALAALRGEDADVDGAADATLAAEAAEGGGIDKIRLETQLKQALAERQLEVRFQPIEAIDARRVAGYEALIRWNHPERGAVSPAEFIKLAEETSLIVPVGRYVLEEVCATLAALGAADTECPYIAVNVSARQTEDDDFLEELVRIAGERRVPVGAVRLEITESLTLDVARVHRLITRCHARGVKVALDDFGTGYSNLGHLHKLRFDTVKLDQGFVRQMLSDARSHAIVRAIVTMVAALGAELVAEGVETEAQMAGLQHLGVRYGQGYLFGRPMAREELVASHA